MKGIDDHRRENSEQKNGCISIIDKIGFRIEIMSKCGRAYIR